VRETDALGIRDDDVVDAGGLFDEVGEGLQLRHRRGAVVGHRRPHLVERGEAPGDVEHPFGRDLTQRPLLHGRRDEGRDRHAREDHQALHHEHRQQTQTADAGRGRHRLLRRVLPAPSRTSSP